MPRKTKTMTWVPIFGHLKSTADGFTHMPLGEYNSQNEGQSLSTLAKSDQYFSAGEIEFACCLSGPEDRVQVVLNQGTEVQLLIGLHAMDSAFGILVLRNGKAESLATAGAVEQLVANREYNIRVEAAGSFIRLFVDGVETCSAFANILRSQVSIYVYSSNKLTVSKFEVKPQKPRAFIVMQFSQEYNELYSEVIKPTCEEFDFECVRGDDIYNNGLIIEDIAREIRGASVVIADITPNNPNVFYEVGFSHGQNKPTILLSERKREKLPFDVSGFRTLYYDNTIGGKATIQSRLREHLRNIKA